MSLGELARFKELEDRVRRLEVRLDAREEDDDAEPATVMRPRRGKSGDKH
jgi:hypothetical protein